MRRTVVGAVVVMAGVVAVQAPARAAVPEVVSFQARLSDSNESPVTDGAHNVTFRIYDSEAAAVGGEIWADTVSVTTKDGLFSVLLGHDTQALGLAFDTQYWLGIEVETDGEMTPRFKLASAPYAMRAASAAAADTATDADTLDGMDSTEFADAATLADPGGTVNDTANPVDWSQLKSVPTDIADGDADTVYTEGTGILISGETISVDPAEVASATHNHDAAYVNTTGDTMTGALILDTDIGADLRIAESGFDRSSDTDQTFEVLNSGAGSMTLLVDGNPVFTTANDGPGSGLDADLVDGKQAADFAASVHTHAGTDVTSPVAQATNADTATTALNGVPSGYFILGETKTPSTGYSFTGYEVSANGVSWTTKAPVALGDRWGFGMAVVSDKIYVIGGGDFNERNEEYDPATNSWTTKADLPTPRHIPAAAAYNGKVYVIGGDDDATGLASTANEEYDPGGNTWASMTAMPTARWGLAVVELGGEIYAIGGVDDAMTPLATVEAYDPVGNSWTTKGSLNMARLVCAAAVVGGKIYVFGGGEPGGTPAAETEEYDPVGDSWSLKASMPTPRGCIGAAVVGGRIYVVGGDTGPLPGVPVATNESYDPTADTWSPEPAMPTRRRLLGVAAVGTWIYAIGGEGATGYDVNEAFDTTATATTKTYYLHVKN